MSFFDPKAVQDDGQTRQDLVEGKYTVMLVDDEETGGINRGQGRQGDYLNLTYKIIEPEQWQGLRIWDIQSLSPASFKFLKRLYNAVEPDESAQSGFDLNDDDAIHAALYYKPLVIDCKFEQKAGQRPRLRPRRHIAILGDEYDRISEIAQQLLHNDGWGAGPRNAGTGPEFSLQQGPGNVEFDDDIPF